MEPSRVLTPEETNEVLALQKEDITATMMRSFFAASLNKPARFNTYDKFTLPKNHFYNKETIETTIGRYIFNIFALPTKYLETNGYCNTVMTKGAISDIENKMGAMVLDDKMTTKEYTDFIDNAEWLSMGNVYYLAPTMDYKMNKPIPEVIKLRDELFEKYATEIAAGDGNRTADIEKELLDLAKKKLKESNVDAMDFFDSGIGKFGNHYKKTSVMGGAMQNPFTKKLEIIKSNFVDGIEKNEINKYSNGTVTAGYSRGVETQNGGYDGKKINNASHAIVVDNDDSDCGTTNFINFKVSDNNKSMLKYRYILDDNGKLTLMTPENISNYVGKYVRMRSPLCCKNEHFCNKCAGEFYKKMGVTSAGMMNCTLSGNMTNMSMGKFHDSTIYFDHVDLNEFIVEA